MKRSLLAAMCLLCLPGRFARAQDVVNPVFLEPVTKIDTGGAEIELKMPLLRRVADPSRYTAWLHNESAERAFRLYRAASDIMRPGGGPPDYYIVLAPGGNHASVGFKLETPSGPVEHAREPYILLDAQQFRFETTLLHETGHMATALMGGGRRLDEQSMISIPHSTAALSDRATAFQEGYAIHLETLQAHVGRDPWMRRHYSHGQAIFGGTDYHTSEYFREAEDLTTYSQTVARYGEVRDNHFAFDSAFQGPDYLRVQLEKARDFAQLRDAGQLLQSEGFYATFFFLLAVRGETVPGEDVIAQRESKTLRAIRGMLDPAKKDNSPWLIDFAVEFIKQFPEEKTALVDVLNDLSHGVFVDAEAAALWRDHYLAALRLDVAHLNMKGITAARKSWREKVLADPRILYSRLGPEIACTVPGTHVRLVALESDEPVKFDVNTVQPGILRLIPGISETEISAWLAERGRQPFTGADDFRARDFLRPATLAALRF